MAKKGEKTKTKELLNKIIEAAQDKKAKDLLYIDLSKTDNSVTTYFVICSGSSTTQVDGIFDNVVDKVIEDLGVKPHHKEGYENSEWILIDYFDIVVHIFIEPLRGFYKLEDLWADGKITRFEDIA